VSGGGKGGDVTIGYKYNLGMHMALCHGPIDNVNQIRVDGRIAWEGLDTGGRIDVDAGELFGGDKREGGVSGPVDMEFGEPAQLPNDYLTSVLPGTNTAYRGVTCAVLRQCYMGNNPYLKGWSFRAQRISVTEYGVLQWYGEKAEISRGIGCVYDCSSLRDTILAIGGWPLDDPQRGTPPLNPYQETAIYTLTAPGSGETDWASGINREWEPTADFCEEDDDTGKRWYARYTPPDHFTIGMTTVEQMQTTYTHVLKAPSSASIIDFQYSIGTGLSNQRLSPRLSVTISGGTASFQSAFVTGNPSVSGPTGITCGDLHVITVRLHLEDWLYDREGTGGYSIYTQRLVWTIWVDDQPQLTLTHDSGERVSIGAPVYRPLDVARVYRDSDAYLGGYAIGVEHETVYLALLENCADSTSCKTDCEDMNPAHIIRECLTQSWGLGYTSADIDGTSFEYAADMLFDESMGMSILWDREIPIEDFIAEILRHIDGVVYVSRSTGKFVLKLIRSDYEEAELVVIDETNARMASDARRPVIGEMTTSVTVSFTDFEQDEEDGSVTVHNEALIQLQGAVSNAKVDYPGFMLRSLASRIALRDLKSLSTPLLSCDVDAGRVAADLNIGDPFKLDFPEQGISSVVMRVESMSVGDGRDNTVRISCLEDAFSVPDFAAIGDIGPGWIDPVKTSPLKSEPRLIVESPYYELVRRVGDREAGLILDDDPDAGFLFANGGRQGNELNADLMVDSGTGYVDSGVLDFAPHAYLSADAWYSDGNLYYSDGKDLDQVSAGDLAQIGAEVVRFDSFGSDVDGDFIAVGRGVLDTVPAEHIYDVAQLIPIVFFSPATDNAQYTASDSIDVKLLTALGSQRLTIAPSDEVVFDSRAIRPYPPGNLTVDAESYPVAKVWDGTHTLAWAHRDRLQQTSGAIFDYSDGNIGPEAGTTYTVTVDAILDTGVISADFIDIDAGAVTTLDIDSAVDGTPPVDAEFIRFKVTANRGGYDSWQAAMIVVSV